jgi:hypothetical protein
MVLGHSSQVGYSAKIVHLFKISNAPNLKADLSQINHGPWQDSGRAAPHKDKLPQHSSPTFLHPQLQAMLPSQCKPE